MGLEAMASYEAGSSRYPRSKIGVICSVIGVGVVDEVTEDISDVPCDDMDVSVARSSEALALLKRPSARISAFASFRGPAL